MAQLTYINESHRKYSEECQKAVEEMSKHPMTYEQFVQQSLQSQKETLLQGTRELEK